MMTTPNISLIHSLEDPLNESFKSEKVENYADQDSPQPLRNQLEKENDYPIEALGYLLGGAALDIHDKIQVPLSICAQSILANAALAVQRHIDICLPFGQIVPVSLYMVSISESGGRKSTSDIEASAFIKKKEEKLRKNYNQDLYVYNNKKDTYEALRRQILNGSKTKGKTKENLQNELNALGTPPKPPMNPLLIVPEPTYEGLCRHFMTGEPSLGLFSDEGGQFIAGHGMNSDNKIKTATGLSNLWGGKPIKRMRSGDGVIILPGKRLSMHLMVQPGIVEKLLADSELLQQGLLSRLLVSYPQHLFGTRLSTNKKIRDGKALTDFNDKMFEILELPLKINKENENNELIPRVLHMTLECETEFYKFSDKIEKRLKDGGDLESIRGFASKLQEQASRIAAIIAFTENPDVEYLDKEHFDRGVLIVEYYASEALRLFGNASTPSHILEAEEFLKWLHNSWPLKTDRPDLISLPDICKFGPNKFRLREKAIKVIKTLEDYGYLSREQNGGIINKKRRKEVWKINGKSFDEDESEQKKSATFANYRRFISPQENFQSEPNLKPFLGGDKYQSIATSATIAGDES